MVLIVMSGCPACGKSTMASNLSKIINAIIIPQDSFYTIPYDKVDHNGEKAQELIDWEAMCRTIVKIQAVSGINIIVEGHRVFTSDLLVELADVLILLENDKNIIKKRFTDRYPENYSTEQLELKGVYFEEKTWPNHEKYTETTVKTIQSSDSDKFIRVVSNLEKGTNTIIEYLKENHL